MVSDGKQEITTKSQESNNLERLRTDARLGRKMQIEGEVGEAGTIWK